MKDKKRTQGFKATRAQQVLAVVASFFMVMSLVILPQPVSAEDGDGTNNVEATSETETLLDGQVTDETHESEGEDSQSVSNASLETNDQLDDMQKTVANDESPKDSVDYQQSVGENPPEGESPNSDSLPDYTNNFLMLAPSNQAKAVQSDEIDLGAPTVSKQIVCDENGNPLRNLDGSYKLRLSVTGKSRQQTEKPKVDVVVVFDTSYSMETNTTNGKTRMAYAKEAVKNISNELLNGNNDVQMSLVTFSAKADIRSPNTTSASNFNQTVDNLSYWSDYQRLYYYIENGTQNGWQYVTNTNWEDAFRKASKINTRPDAQKYVIFVSDGNPSARDTKGDYSDSYRENNKSYVDSPYANSYNQEPYLYGNGLEDVQTNVERSYETALPYAKQLASSSTHSYYVGIGTTDGIARMQSLANECSGSYYPATDTSLASVLSDIAAAINRNYSYKDVSVEDTLSSAVTGTDVDGTVSNFKFKYYKNDANSSLSEWTEAPHANYDRDSKKVTWDLSKINGNDYTLKDGVTYTVEFDVKLTQADYDNAAILKNEGKSSDSNVVVDGDGVSAYTNLVDSDSNHSRVNYTQFTAQNGTEVSGSEKSGSVILDPQKVPVPTSEFTVAKVWDGVGTKPDSLSISVLQDGQPYKADGTTPTSAVLNESNSWSQTIVVPAGPVGHTYSIQEDVPDNWKLKGYSYNDSQLSASADTGSDYIKQLDAVSRNTLSVTNEPDTYNLRIHKYVGNTEPTNGTGLKGATFTLTPANEDWSSKNGASSISVTTNDYGIADFTGLLKGKYIVSETHVPAGYQNLDGDRYLEIKEDPNNPKKTVAYWYSKDANGHIDEQGSELSTGEDKDNGFKYFKVAIGNATIPNLPVSGGLGVWPMLGAGSALIVAGVALVVLRKREG